MTKNQQLIRMHTVFSDSFNKFFHNIYVHFSRWLQQWQRVLARTEILVGLVCWTRLCWCFNSFRPNSSKQHLVKQEGCCHAMQESNGLVPVIFTKLPLWRARKYAVVCFMGNDVRKVFLADCRHWLEWEVYECHDTSLLYRTKVHTPLSMQWHRKTIQKNCRLLCRTFPWWP